MPERELSAAELVAGFAAADYIDYRAWPPVATHLVGAGLGGSARSELAGSDLGAFDAWDVERLIVPMLVELDAPTTDLGTAYSVVAKSVALLWQQGRLDVPQAVKHLSRLYSDKDYPNEPAILSKAFEFDEYMTCECHRPPVSESEALLADQVVEVSPVTAAIAAALVAGLPPVGAPRWRSH